MMQLEQIFGYKPMLAQEKRQELYVVGDLRSLSASALYGDMDRGYDFRESGFQLHIHEDSREGITGANIKPYGEQHGIGLNNYEALMAEARAKALGIPKIDIRR